MREREANEDKVDIEKLKKAQRLLDNAREAINAQEKLYGEVKNDSF